MPGSMIHYDTRYDTSLAARSSFKYVDRGECFVRRCTWDVSRLAPTVLSRARARNTRTRVTTRRCGGGEEGESERGGEDPGFYGSDRRNLRPEIVARRPWKDDAVKIQPNLSSTRGECFIAASGINKGLALASTARVRGLIFSWKKRPTRFSKRRGINRPIIGGGSYLSRSMSVLNLSYLSRGAIATS